MNNTVKGGGKKGDRETRVWFSPAGPPPDLRLGLQIWKERRGKRELPDGGDGVAIKACPTLGRYEGKEEFCCD